MPPIRRLRRARRPLRILYLLQRGLSRSLPTEVLGTPLEILSLKVDDPTRHRAVYEALVREVCPRLGGEVHINVSPGTPAMHAVWLVLHAGGALPAGARLWSSQWNPETKRTRLDSVDFTVTTYLAEVRRRAAAQPDVAAYETEARSPARRALERLARYARVIGAPLLILGERGTGKTRLVETHVRPLKQRAKVVSLACGGLDSTLAESLLFGHRKGAFTGAASDRLGLLAEADGGILFLDEVQDPAEADSRAAGPAPALSPCRQRQGAFRGHRGRVRIEPRARRAASTARRRSLLQDQPPDRTRPRAARVPRRPPRRLVARVARAAPRAVARRTRTMIGRCRARARGRPAAWQPSGPATARAAGRSVGRGRRRGGARDGPGRVAVPPGRGPPGG
ncbi:Response regulator of zinc sigma-54-dependent two-component system [Minicystis rosea]|nr:Response regulator of zinc sigma-54-dependent two-component system [Minicystis rosea]